MSGPDGGEVEHGQVPGPQRAGPLQGLAVSNAYEFAALVAVLERKGLLT